MATKQFGHAGVSLTRESSDDLLLIEAYGDGGFKARGRRFRGSLLVSTEGLWPVDAAGIDDVEIGMLGPLRADGRSVELVLIGTGETMTLIPQALRQALEAEGLGYDLMDTGAAARTYNVLAMEGRHVAALLLAVD